MRNSIEWRCARKWTALVRFSALGIGSGLALTSIAQQADFPQVIRIIAPFAPGGATDLYARVIAEKLGTRLHRSVIVENKPGASGWIGTKYVADGPKDGSVLMSFSSSVLTNAATTPKAAVDVMKTLIPVAIMSEMPLMVVASPKSKITTPAQLLEAARKQEGALSYATGGAGTSVHLATELFASQANVKLTHIAYKGGSGANTDVAGGHVDFTMAAPATVQPLVTAGLVNSVGITSLQPSAAFPGVPTIASVLPGYEANVWTAIWASSGTPSVLVQRLNTEINEIVKTPEFQKLMKDDGGIALSLTPAQALEKSAKTYKFWKELAVAKHISVQP